MAIFRKIFLFAPLAILFACSSSEMAGGTTETENAIADTSAMVAIQVFSGSEQASRVAYRVLPSWYIADTTGKSPLLIRACDLDQDNVLEGRDPSQGPQKPSVSSLLPSPSSPSLPFLSDPAIHTRRCAQTQKGAPVRWGPRRIIALQPIYRRFTKQNINPQCLTGSPSPLVRSDAS